MKMKPDELAEAFLALSPKEFDQFWRHVCFVWTWERAWWKPTTRRRDLVKAGALILAEIERLDRAAAPQPEEPK